MDGFTYNGVHCESLGLYYIPDASDRWNESPDFEVYEDTAASRHGGYWYDTRARTRVFSLNCYFEDITLEMREKIRHW